ncbi:hypothetical protein BAE30_10170 [Acidithiobacillus caldus]|uniref:Uncharacterized protein n=1 Tax=Acidithiobacillus caldus TaxID=33059 RepID=A0A1E7YU30_9PROT|nr:hypothetical protein BAE30_10170 [Acidithiobacillus caldus]
MWEGTVVPKRLFARVAPYLEAIESARRAGWTWAELAERLAGAIGTVRPRSLANACAVARRLSSEGVLQVPQRPLPDEDPSGHSERGHSPRTAPVPPTVQGKPATAFPRNIVDLDK